MNKQETTETVNLSQDGKEKQNVKPKWYCSYPVLVISFIFCFPISLILSLLRLWTIKYQGRGYKIRSILAVSVNAAFILLIAGIIVFDGKWDREFQGYLAAQEYQDALITLDGRFGNNMTKTGLDYYFDFFEASGDYSGADEMVLKYFEALQDKTVFDPSVFAEIEAVSDKLSVNQLDRIEEIKAGVELAKKEKAEEESRKAAERESAQAAKESSKAERELAKAEEESRKAAERESAQAAKESSKAERESAQAAKESSKAERELAKVEEESRKAAERESVRQKEESKTEADTQLKTKEESKALAEEKARTQVEEESQKAGKKADEKKENQSASNLNNQINSPVKTGKFEFMVTDAYVLYDLGPNKKVPEGAVYVVIEFEYKNISKQPISSWSLPTVGLMDGNKAVYSQDSDAKWYFGGYSDQKIISDMNPGIKTKGTNIFEVSEEVLREGGMKAYVKADREFTVDLDLFQTSAGRSGNNTDFSEDYGNAVFDYPGSDIPYYSDIGDLMDTPYILIENSSTEYLSDSDIYWMTPEQLRYAKNEIYARHGRKFKDVGLQAWFDDQNWYTGRIAPEDFKEDMLSAVEKANIQVIQHRLEVNSR